MSGDSSKGVAPTTLRPRLESLESPTTVPLNSADEHVASAAARALHPAPLPPARPLTDHTITSGISSADSLVLEGPESFEIGGSGSVGGKSGSLSISGSGIAPASPTGKAGGFSIGGSGIAPASHTGKSGSLSIGGSGTTPRPLTGGAAEITIGGSGGSAALKIGDGPDAPSIPTTKLGTVSTGCPTTVIDNHYYDPVSGKVLTINYRGEVDSKDWQKCTEELVGASLSRISLFLDESAVAIQGHSGARTNFKDLKAYHFDYRRGVIHIEFKGGVHYQLEAGIEMRNLMKKYLKEPTELDKLPEPAAIVAGFKGMNHPLEAHHAAFVYQLAFNPSLVKSLESAVNNLKESKGDKADTDSKLMAYRTLLHLLHGIRHGSHVDLGDKERKGLDKLLNSCSSRSWLTALFFKPKMDPRLGDEWLREVLHTFEKKVSQDSGVATNPLNIDLTTKHSCLDLAKELYEQHNLLPPVSSQKHFRIDFEGAPISTDTHGLQSDDSRPALHLEPQFVIRDSAASSAPSRILTLTSVSCLAQAAAVSTDSIYVHFAKDKENHWWQIQSNEAKQVPWSHVQQMASFHVASLGFDQTSPLIAAVIPPAADTAVTTSAVATAALHPLHSPAGSVATLASPAASPLTPPISSPGASGHSSVSAGVVPGSPLSLGSSSPVSTAAAAATTPWAFASAASPLAPPATPPLAPLGAAASIASPAAPLASSLAAAKTPMAKAATIAGAKAEVRLALTYGEVRLPAEYASYGERPWGEQSAMVLAMKKFRQREAAKLTDNDHRDQELWNSYLPQLRPLLAAAKEPLIPVGKLSAEAQTAIDSFFSDLASVEALDNSGKGSKHILPHALSYNELQELANASGHLIKVFTDKLPATEFQPSPLPATGALAELCFAAPNLDRKDPRARVALIPLTDKISPIAFSKPKSPSSPVSPASLAGSASSPKPPVLPVGGVPHAGSTLGSRARRAAGTLASGMVAEATGAAGIAALGATGALAAGAGAIRNAFRRRPPVPPATSAASAPAASAPAASAAEGAESPLASSHTGSTGFAATPRNPFAGLIGRRSLDSTPSTPSSIDPAALSPTPLPAAFDYAKFMADFMRDGTSPPDGIALLFCEAVKAASKAASVKAASWSADVKAALRTLYADKPDTIAHFIAFATALVPMASDEENEAQLERLAEAQEQLNLVHPELGDQLLELVNGPLADDQSAALLANLTALFPMEFPPNPIS